MRIRRSGSTSSQASAGCSAASDSSLAAPSGTASAIRSAGPARTQAALAEFIGADKSRIIGVLDELENAGLLERTRDPADRRARFVAITDEGRRRHDTIQADIQRNEERLLAHLPPGDREAFLRSLDTLATLPDWL